MAEKDVQRFVSEKPRRWVRDRPERLKYIILALLLLLLAGEVAAGEFSSIAEGGWLIWGILVVKLLLIAFLIALILVQRGVKFEIRRKKARPKLDPRLAFVLRLPRRKLRAMKAREDAQIREAAKKVRERMKAGEKETTEDREHLYDELFAPLFHGIYLPRTREPLPPGNLTEDYASVFIKFHGNREDLERLGIRVRSQAGDVFTAFLPLRLIARLERMPAVEFIELAKPLFPTLDESVPVAEIDMLHTAGTTGVGTAVGIFDTWLDFYHPNFRHDDGGGTDGLGSTRVRFLWNQRLVAQGDPATPGPWEQTPTPWGYGVEYPDSSTDADQQTINKELNKAAADPAYEVVRGDELDYASEHGSHVAGIAAGNGQAVGNDGEPAGTFTGAAPEAEIIYVRKLLGQNEEPLTDSTLLADGCDYIFTRAADLGLPCAINVSTSDDQGPHDGSSLGQEFLDNLLEMPGRVITLSAGNSNNKGSHASGQVAAGATEDLVLRYLAGAARNDDVNIWYDGHDAFSVRVTEPGGDSYGPVNPGDPPLIDTLSNGEQIQITSTINPANGDNLISIIVTASSIDPIPDGDWTISLTGTTVVNGRFQAWVDRNNRSRSDWLAPHLTRDELTLGDLSCTRRPITVGSHSKPAPGNIADSSGCGSTRDGRIKPEIATVGVGVMSVRSRDMNAPAPGDFYVGMSGTSMAAPLACGTAALLFQCRGAAQTWADIKHVLEENADTTGLVTPHNAFGFGRLRTGNACVAPPADVDVWLKNEAGPPEDTGIEPFPGSYSWESPDIEILGPDHLPILNPIHGTDAAGDPIDNFVRVTVRNRGTQTARNTEVYLYWGDPATNMPFSTAWNDSGIYTPVGPGPDWVEEGNKIVIPEITPGGHESVEFRWLPPAPGSNIRGDDHFCLVVRVENELDNTHIGAGEVWWPLIRNDNNITARNVHIVEVPEGEEDVDFGFYVVGTAWNDALWVESDLPEGALIMQFPALAIPFRDMRMVNELGGPRPPYPGYPCTMDPLDKEQIDLEGRQIELLTRIQGAEWVRFEQGTATLHAQAGKLLRLPEIRIQKDARMPVRLTVRNFAFKEEAHRLRVCQISDGRRVGGVTLEIRRGTGGKREN